MFDDELDELEDYEEELEETGGKEEGCYIATAVYGSYDCPPVWTLRRFRDERLKKSWYGRLFIRIYYRISPTLVRLFGKTKWFNVFFKGILDRIVNRLEN